MLCTRTILAILFLVLQACANIVLNEVQPACDHLLSEPNQGCLGDQTCLPDNSCEKNYGPGIRDEHTAHDAGSGGQSVNVLANDMTASAIPVDDGGAAQSSPLRPLGPINHAIGSGLYSAIPATPALPALPATTSVTTPNVPYSNDPENPCEDDLSAPATASFSNTIPFWPLPTICLDTPRLCETGPFQGNVHSDKTKSPRMITPAAQTAHRERSQGWLAPPRPQVATSSSQPGYIGSMGANPNNWIPLSTGPVHIAQKVPTAHVMGATQDPQAAHLEHPALNLDIRRHGRFRRTLPSGDLASEPLPVALDARAKIPRPQPQTARAMATLGALLGGPQIGGPDNGHPVGAGSSAGKLNKREELTALIYPRGEDKQTTTEDDEDTDASTVSVWDSHANHVRGLADSFMVALMAAISSALVLVMIL